MNMELQTDSKGVEYQVINGTFYHKDTPKIVITRLENARINHSRIRMFYGDRTTGKDWLEENDVIGYVGRSTGRVKIPLIINNDKSWGGLSILDHCIVKLMSGHVVTYQHPNYHTGELAIVEGSEYAEKGYSHSVTVDDVVTANFKSKEKAQRYVDFIEGKRLNH